MAGYSGEVLCTPKVVGGLGMNDLDEMNTALLAKKAYLGSWVLLGFEF